MKNTEDLEVLLDKVLHDPLNFKQEEFESALKLGLDFDHLRTLVKKIYDLNESDLIRISSPTQGMLGKWNKKSSDKREKRYGDKVDRQTADKQYFRIYAEGDSWFQFPVFIKDIIDWLDEKDDFLIASDAYGGDWITNILYDGQYVSGLSNYAPDFFLISGGGNDIVGSYKIAMLVDEHPDYKVDKYKNPQEIKSVNLELTEEEKQTIYHGHKFFTKEFHALILVFRFQYTLLFSHLYKDENKHNHVISITQGYDYPIPDNKRRFSLTTPLQPVVNSLLDTGKWLFTPLMIKKVLNRGNQRSILFAMIYEFNEMMAQFALDFEKVYHVDSRGLARDQSDWYDELHLKSQHFKTVAKAYEHIIRNHPGGEVDKIVRSADFRG